MPIDQNNPVVRVLAAIVTIAILALAVFLGAFLIAAAVGIVVLLVLVTMVRGWWLRRKLGKATAAGGTGTTIEGEYTVRSREDK